MQSLGELWSSESWPDLNLPVALCLTLGWFQVGHCTSAVNVDWLVGSTVYWCAAIPLSNRLIIHAMIHTCVFTALKRGWLLLGPLEITLSLNYSEQINESCSHVNSRTVWMFCLNLSIPNKHPSSQHPEDLPLRKWFHCFLVFNQVSLKTSDQDQR